MTNNIQKYYELVLECMDAIRSNSSNASELAQEMTRVEKALSREERAYINSRPQKQWIN